MRPGRVAALAWRVVVWAALLALLAVLAAAVLVPRLTGATPFTITTGSMQPGLPPGTLLVTRPTPVEEIGIGTVITYQLESGRAAVVTHRVVGIGFTGTDERVLTTQGDANDTPDREPVRPEQVRGTAWYAVPHLGRVGSQLSGSQRQAATTVLAVGLIVYAAYMITSAAHGRIARRTISTSSTTTTSTATKEEAP